MVLPIGFISFIFLIFGNIGQNTVIQTVESPSGKYYAQVIDSDQGALGGNTRVDVYERSEINAFLFKIKKKPRRVYSGDYGEFHNMQIYWKDDECLIINSTEYKIQQHTRMRRIQLVPSGTKLGGRQFFNCLPHFSTESDIILTFFNITTIINSVKYFLCEDVFINIFQK